MRTLLFSQIETLIALEWSYFSAGAKRQCKLESLNSTAPGPGAWLENCLIIYKVVGSQLVSLWHLYTGYQVSSLDPHQHQNCNLEIPSSFKTIHLGL